MPCNRRTTHVALLSDYVFGRRFYRTIPIMHRRTSPKRIDYRTGPIIKKSGLFLHPAKVVVYFAYRTVSVAAIRYRTYDGRIFYRTVPIMHRLRAIGPADYRTGPIIHTRAVGWNRGYYRTSAGADIIGRKSGRLLSDVSGHELSDDPTHPRSDNPTHLQPAV